MADILPENVTLADLLAEGRLSNPPRYLRLALANVLAAEDFPAVTLRIGRTGNGVWPAYVLERKNGSLIGRFDGQTHKPWPDGDETAHHDENWSNKRTTAAGLHDLWYKVVTF